MNTCRIGVVGVDTSHVHAFASLLHDTSNEYHVPGARIVAAFPGGSEDFSLSISRVEGYTAALRSNHGVEIVGSLCDLRGKCDAIMLESIDGRVHLEQFREVAEWSIPVFIDKPMTISSQEAGEIARLAGERGIPTTSASALRFAEKFREALVTNNTEPLTGIDCYGPMAFVEGCPGYFWYGIHSVEMLFAALGTGCREVLAMRAAPCDIVIGRWGDGRLGTLRGNHTGNEAFGGILHRQTASVSFDVSKGRKPFYACLLEKVIPFFHGEAGVVELSEAVEVIRFLEAANQSVLTRKWVAL